MSSDFLEQLAEIEVAPPPPEFDRELHQRVNRTLLAQQAANLAVGAVPGAIVEFLRAVTAALAFSIAGHYPQERQEKIGDQL
jgi:hypothetical protein